MFNNEETVVAAVPDFIYTEYVISKVRQPPRHPSTVFPGLIEGTILCLPKSLPKAYELESNRNEAPKVSRFRDAQPTVCKYMIKKNGMTG